MSYPLAEFLFTAAMLRRTPRSGLQFLGSGRESVAEHVFEVMIVAYTLVHMARRDGLEIDENRVLKLCLVHDLPESRTGDLNYVNKKYLKVDEEKAMADMCGPLFFGDELAGLLREFEKRESPEACLAADADQLALMVLLREESDLGNRQADKWLAVASQRLLTEYGRQLALELKECNWSAWWFTKDSRQWWINGRRDGERR